MIEQHVITTSYYVDKQELANAFSNLDTAKTDQEKKDFRDAVIALLSDDREVEIETEIDTEDEDKPLLASDFNAYDFKRQMCGFFETGYHVDSFDLVKLLAEKLQVDYLL